jgi:hypothetical protein
MPVNQEPIEEPAEFGIASRLAIRSREVAGASDRLPLRVIILFILSIVCVTLAQVPFNLVGVAAIVLLALDTAAHRR